VAVVKFVPANVVGAAPVVSTRNFVAAVALTAAAADCVIGRFTASIAASVAELMGPNKPFQVPQPFGFVQVPPELLDIYQ
jgi:hypothetical protein